jgi:23S rRNA (cytidine1920-2'-O)/16S rRNA (cytidine1409-2'-O)-methyltransferase
METARRGCASWRNFWYCAAPKERIGVFQRAASADQQMSDKPPKQKIEKQRLDLLLVERGLAESRQKAQAMLLAGEVRVAGQRHDKPGARVPIDAPVEITATHLRYVSRGGFKLEGALDDFGVNPAGKICLDVGSSTGGFTDCLLQRGATHVYAVDVTPDQMAWKLQQDPRVTRIKRNARELTPGDIITSGTSAGTFISPQLVVIDLAFISVAKVLSAVAAAAGARAEFLILTKPQFELDRGDIGKGGIVRDAKLHERAIERVREAARQVGLQQKGVKPSKLPGAEGNLEFFLYATR